MHWIKIYSSTSDDSSRRQIVNEFQFSNMFANINWVNEHETWYHIRLIFCKRRGKKKENLFAITSVMILPVVTSSCRQISSGVKMRHHWEAVKLRLLHQVLFYYGLIVLSSLKSHNSSADVKRGEKEGRDLKNKGGMTRALFTHQTQHE